MTVNSKINCGGCIAKVNTDLNELLGEELVRGYFFAQ